MRIAIVAPTFPPEHCGVGDYSACLALALAKQGHQVGVWTAQMQPAMRHPGMEVHTVAGLRTWRGLRDAIDPIAAFKADRVLIQYTPYMFAPGTYGVDPLLALWVYQLRARTGATLCLVAHEMNYPVEATSKGLLIGVPQALQFKALMAASDRVFFTWEKALPSPDDPKYVWIPVGANLRTFVAADTDFGKLPEGRQPRLLLHFGGAHPTHLLGHIFYALNEAQRRFGKDQVGAVFMGLTQQKIESILAGSGWSHLASSIQGLGWQSPADAVRWLKRSELILAPFMDGVSARRGSVMAAFEESRAVVTNLGRSSDPSMDWAGACAVSGDSTVKVYSEKVLELLDHPDRARDIARRGRELFDAKLSWERIATQMVER